MWPENSILNRYSPYTPCNEIHQAFCDALGDHCARKGMKYAKSGPKITYRDKRSKVVLSFHSSRSNTPGQSVLVELGIALYDLSWDKSKALLFTHSLFSRRLPGGPKGLIRIENAYGELLERREKGKEAEFRNTAISMSMALTRRSLER